MTLAPFDTKPLIKELMTDAEIRWLNGYHAMVREELSPELERQDLEWLRKPPRLCKIRDQHEGVLINSGATRCCIMT